MREFKFRGKSIETGEWVYGSLITPTFSKSNDIFAHYIHETNKINYFSTGGSKLENFYEMPLVGIEPKTTGQYTGLNDKNGKEIYEGDIIKITHEDGYSENYTIQYMAHNDYPAFDTVPSIDCDANGLSHAKACCETEVIGNIYQNSELLKVIAS